MFRLTPIPRPCFFDFLGMLSYNLAYYLRGNIENQVPVVPGRHTRGRTWR